MLMVSDPEHRELYILSKTIDANEDAVTPTYRYTIYIKRPEQQQLRSIWQWSGADESKLRELVGMVWDKQHQRLVLADKARQEIFSIDSQSHQSLILSNQQRGAGPAFLQLGRMALDTNTQQLLVVDQAENSTNVNRLITAVDLVTGDRTNLTRAADSYDRIGSIIDISFDALYNRAYITDGRDVWALDRYTGQQFILASYNTNFDGEPLLLATSNIAIAPNSTNLLVVDPLIRRILSVDTATGIAKVLTGKQAGEGPGLCPTQALLATEENTLAIDSAASRLLKIDAQGNRNVLQEFGISDDCSVSVDSNKIPVAHTFVKKSLRNLSNVVENANTNSSTQIPVANNLHATDEFILDLLSALSSFVIILALTVIGPFALVYYSVLSLFQPTSGLQGTLTRLSILFLSIIAIPLLITFGGLYLAYDVLIDAILLIESFFRTVHIT